jgi:hypothetical protein
MTTTKQPYQLLGKVCPRCESTGPFLLDPSDKFTVTADGTLEFPSDEWGLDIDCECPTCGFATRLEEFCEWVEVTGSERMDTIAEWIQQLESESE